jgi:hypothetical protein
VIGNIWWWHYCYDSLSLGSWFWFALYGVEIWAGVLPVILTIWGIQVLISVFT